MRTVLAAAVLVVGVLAACGDDGGGSGGTMCTADALLGPNGESYGRSAEHDCAFVDEDGKPVCFDDAVRVPCE